MRVRIHAEPVSVGNDGNTASVSAWRNNNVSEIDLEAGPVADYECPICMDSGDGVWFTPMCGHAFHLACINGWAAARNTCPICRRGVFL